MPVVQMKAPPKTAMVVEVSVSSARAQILQHTGRFNARYFDADFAAERFTITGEEKLVLKKEMKSLVLKVSAPVRLRLRNSGGDTVEVTVNQLIVLDDPAHLKNVVIEQVTPQSEQQNTDGTYDLLKTEVQAQMTFAPQKLIEY